MSAGIQYASFIIRLWRPVNQEDEIAFGWQSEVEHIQSGKTWRFVTFDEMEGFLRQQSEHPEGLDWIETDTEGRGP